jgi:hypothetical protein
MTAFPTALPDFPWWGWFLCSAGAVALCLLSCLEIGDAGIEERSPWPYYVIAAVTGVAAIACFVLSIGVFAKWAWSGWQ